MFDTHFLLNAQMKLFLCLFLKKAIVNFFIYPIDNEKLKRRFIVGNQKYKLSLSGCIEFKSLITSIHSIRVLNKALAMSLFWPKELRSSCWYRLYICISQFCHLWACCFFSGIFKPGINAILGATGSGKTS